MSWVISDARTHPKSPLGAQPANSKAAAMPFRQWRPSRRRSITIASRAGVAGGQAWKCRKQARLMARRSAARCG
jgi:hypothetical protein